MDVIRVGQRFLFSHQRLDRLMDGESTILVANVVILYERLEKEIVTEGHHIKAGQPSRPSRRSPNDLVKSVSRP